MKKKLTLLLIMYLMLITECTYLTNSHPTPDTGDSLLRETVTPALAWSHTITDGRIGSALIEDGIAYFSIQVGGIPTKVEAYDLRTQQTRWVISEATDAPLVLGDGKLFLLDRDEGISSISVEDGTTVWHTPLPAHGYEYEMTFGNGLLFFGVGNVIYAMNTTDGHILWQRSVPSGFRINQAWLGNTNVYREYDALSYYDGILYVRTCGVAQDRTRECLFYVMDAVEGQERWRLPFSIPLSEESPPPMAASRPAFDQVLLFFSDWGGRAYLTNKDTGEVIWQDTAEFPVARPLLQNGRVYIPTRDSLLSLSVETGETLWSTLPSESWVASPIRAMGDIILVLIYPLGGRQTEVALINAITGELIYKTEILDAEECTGCVTAFEVDSGSLYIIQRQTIIAFDVLPYRQ